MKYWTRRDGSQRASATRKIKVMDIPLRNDGATYDPILWILVDDVWHAIEFENEGEARVLMSYSQHIFRSFK